MAMAALVARTSSPITIDSLAAQLGEMGLMQGDIVLVHTSLSSLGWVNGGPVAVTEALIKAVGGQGTIIMPSQSSNLTVPMNWSEPAVPKAWVQTIRDTMPVYDPLTTPTSYMSSVVEVFRNWRGAIRSGHPSTSFVARGPFAATLMAGHRSEDPLGETSPLGKMYRLNRVKIVLIGVGFDRCTALHLAECKRWPDRPKAQQGAPMLVDGKREWAQFEVPQELNNEAFLSIGASAIASGMARVGQVREGQGTVMSMRELVDHAVCIWSEDRRS